MSLKIKHQDDGSITIECGGQTIVLHRDGIPIASQEPIKIKPIRGKGAGHQALDIAPQGASTAPDDDATVLDVGEELELTEVETLELFSS